MKRIVGYGVVSECKGGLLVGTSPSVWILCIESAIRYETPALAWAAANRRHQAQACAVEIIEDDGTLSWEPLPAQNKTVGGDWVVWFHLTSTAPRLFVMKSGIPMIASRSRSDAKGYKQKSAAEKLATKLSKDGTHAGVEQITAQIIPLTRKV